MGSFLLKSEASRNIDLADERAFGIAASLYRPKVFNYFLASTCDEDLAEDLTQETFLKAFEHRADYDPSQANVLLWFIHAAREVCGIHRRNRGGEPRPFPQRIEPEAHSDSMVCQDGSDIIFGQLLGIDQIVQGGAQFEMAEKRLWGRMYEQVSEVPVEQRQALMLHVAFGLNYIQIAEMTHSTPGNVQYRAKRALRLIKQIDGIDEVAEMHFVGYKLV